MQMQRLVVAMGRRLHPRVRQAVLGSWTTPSFLANAIHSLLNCLPGERFPCLPCGGILKGYRMRVDWSRHRSFLYGCWEPEIQEALLDLVREGSCALDIGAHIGYYTLLLSKLVGSRGKVIAFEPLPENFDVLEENIQLNLGCHVEAVNKAVFESSSQLELGFTTDSPFPGTASLFAEPGLPLVRVDAVSLDDFLHDRNERIDFIKIDVEGAEEQVLQGARRTIERDHPTLIIEVHHPGYAPETSRVLPILASWGYRTRWLQRSAVTSHLAAV